jgi:isopenicillin N synthase-like dioxygenase
VPSTEHLDQSPAAGEWSASQVPDIDVSALFGTDGEARARVVEAIGRACRAPGFFRIHRTGIPQPLVEALLSHMRGFFARPDDDPTKRAVHNSASAGGNGWGPIGAEPAYQPGTIAHVESFDCGPRLSSFRADEDPSTYGIHPSQWPAIPGFHETTRAYWDAAGRLGKALFEALAESLALPSGFFTSRCTERARKALRLLHYPGLPPGADVPGRVGIAAHTDFECFTLMYQTAPGLELSDATGRFFRVPDEADRFTVILGDMLERWTNGTLLATGHRVAATPWPRYSVVLFFAVDPEHVIAPLPPFVSETRPARYEPTTQGGHIQAELERARRNRDQASGQRERGATVPS